MQKVERIKFANADERKEAINKICDYLEKSGNQVHISNHYSEDRDSGVGFNRILSIDELRNLKEILGFIDIDNKEYSISLSNCSCSYFKLLK